MSLSVWVLPPCAPPTPLTATLLSLSVLVEGLVLLPGPPRAPPTTPPRYLCLSDGGGGVDTWSPSRTPKFSIYIRPGGYWIKLITIPLLDYVDNISLVPVMEE